MDETIYAVIDANARKPGVRYFGLSARYVEWELLRQGATLAGKVSDADVILATVVSPQEYTCVPSALKANGIAPLAANRLRQTVVLGGYGMYSPRVFDPYIDYGCVGEGRKFIETLVHSGIGALPNLPNCYIPGDNREVIPDYNFPYDCPPTLGEDGVVHVYASRGCRKACLFCQTGWCQPYSEHDPSDVSQTYAGLVRAGQRVNVVTNDAPALAAFGGIPKTEAFSASYSQLREIMRDGVGPLVGRVKSVRIGVESPSARLRKCIGKPIPTDKLYALTCDLLNAGIGVRWFLIAGLPGETDADWGELYDVVRRARHDIKKGALQLSFTAFVPDPAAPLCIAPLTDDYYDRYLSFWKWFFEGAGYTRKIQLFKCSAPPGRLKKAMASMAATEAELRRGWADHDPPNWCVRYHHRGKIRQTYETYARKVGIV